MAPAVIPDYSKALDQPVQGLLANIFEQYFYNDMDGNLYRLEICPIKGSTYSGAVIVYKLNYAKGDEYPEYYAGKVFSESQCKISAADEALKLGIPYESEIQIARYVFKDMDIEMDSGRISGKQIRGAFVDPDYEGVHITKHVYLTLMEQHGTVISDFTQSIAGHKLWAFGVCKWGVVKLYDDNQKQMLVELLPRGDTPVNGVIPWSASTLTAQEQEALRKGHWELGNLRHIVLVLSNHHS
ncbi:hypothetical protein IFO68_21195 [Photobacterium sp. CAU 1568]|uniref:Uncharacterized protein n=1 Tax=Photobacterium arenosum TaxID=2774143 RepID=A0ABR9BRJ5_9GAMM|nr:hypothetical protein [Photobacterium arenosum]MBD8515199.1 hypothetical protein [Photobacterium arenosum]